MSEIRKHRHFREVWIGYLLAAAYLYMGLSDNFAGPDMDQNWFITQQDIRSCGIIVLSILVGIGLPHLISYEWERGTQVLIRTAKRGALYTYLNKVRFALIYCLVCVLLVGGISLLVHGSAFNWGKAMEPMINCIGFDVTHMSSITYLEYSLIQYGLLFLGTLYFAGFVMLTAALLKKTVPTLLVCGGLQIFFIYDAYVGIHIGGVLREIINFMFQRSFTGFMILESYYWQWPFGFLNGGFENNTWSDLWKPVTYVCIMILLEFTVLYFVYRKRDKK